MNSIIFRLVLSIISMTFILPTSASADQRSIEVPGIGMEVEGAGMTISNLDKNPRPEMILMVYDTSPRPANFRYKIGWNLDTTGTAAGWSNDIEIPGVGFKAQGAGVTVAQLDKDPRPELILMAYDYIKDVNSFRYKIGWNLNSTGMTLNWSKDYIEVRGVGWEGSGAGTVVAQLDDNPAPELIIMAYDNGYFINFFRYRVGWNLDTNGRAVDWSNYLEGLGVGWEGSGAGIDIVQLDNNPRPDIILLGYDNFPDQPPFFRYRVGWNLDTNGMAAKWSDYTRMPPVEPGVKAADITVFNLDSDPRPEFIIMAYYGTPQKSSFVYHILENRGPARGIHLEMDKLTGVQWPPGNVLRQGTRHSLRGIFALCGIDLNPVRDDGAIVDIKKGRPYTDAEVHCLSTTHADKKDTAPTGILPLYTALLTFHTEGISGMMFTLDRRRGTVVFANRFKDSAAYLRILAHQLGQALNLKYSDGDAWQGCFTYSKGITLMNPTWKLAADWNFTWSAASLAHFYHHRLNQWQTHKNGKYKNCH